MLLATLLITLSSCSVESTIPLSAKSYEFPDLSLTDAIYIFGRSGERPLTITADEIAFYEKSNQAKLTGLTFLQTDEHGTLILSGHADQATVNTLTNDATLMGSVVLNQNKEEFTLETESLHWQHENQLLTSSESEGVHITFDGGQTIEGGGFTGNLKTGTYRFSAPTQGVLER